MFCAKCGKEIAEGTRFCPGCGQEVGAAPKTESAFAGIMKAASEAKQKAAEKLDGLNQKLNEAEEKDAEKEKNKIDPVSADEKDWQSVAEIIAQKKESIFKLQGAKNALLGTTSFKMRGEISEAKAKSLAQKAALGKIQPSDIVAVYDNKNEGKIVFTDYAMYATEKMMKPIAVKYADITEAGVNKENAGQAVVRLANGLEWTITNNNYVDMNALAGIIATLSVFAKRRDEDEKSRSIESSAEQEATPLLKLIGFAVLTVIFSWNCYAIFHNFSVGSGIGWAIVAIIVNLAILYPLAGWAALLAETVTRKQGLAEKLVSKKIIWAFPLILLILFGARGCGGSKGGGRGNIRHAIKELESINNESSRYWAALIEENGIDAAAGGDTLLTEAVKSGNLALVQACVKSGTDVNRIPDKRSPLALSLDGYKLDITKYLLEHKADVNLGYVNGSTRTSPLCTVLRDNTMNDKKYEAVKLLLSYKPRLVEEGGETNDALSYAFASEDETMYSLIMPELPKGALDFTNPKNTHTDPGTEIIGSLRLKALAPLITKYGYRPTIIGGPSAYYTLVDFKSSISKDGNADNERRIEALKTLAEEQYYKDKDKELAKAGRYGLLHNLNYALEHIEYELSKARETKAKAPDDDYYDYLRSEIEDGEAGVKLLKDAKTHFEKLGYKETY